MWSDPEVMRFLPHRLSPSVEDSQRVLTWLHDRFYDAHMLAWAITLKSQDRCIGGLRYYEYTGHNFLIAEIGYELERACWGQGLMTEALAAAVDFGFHRIGLSRIQATAHPDNAASRRVLTKVGFAEEGILRRWSFNERTAAWEDRVMHSILRPDGQHPCRWLI
jgi:ribosomal-protein-alanine N-acetyltransferase